MKKKKRLSEVEKEEEGSSPIARVKVFSLHVSRKRGSTTYCHELVRRGGVPR